jgi:putative tryptophan/tyrosine transport system substrate-binding protein
VTGRRKFLLGFAALTVIGSARAQRQGRIYRIGLLVPALEPTPVDQTRLQVLRSALSELGWVDGTNLIIESRYVGVTPQRMRDVAVELKDIPVALIIAPGTIMIRAARDGAPGVPIIMVNAGDPVGSGFAVSLARPGGDLTGTSAAGEEVLAKQLELLSIAVPRLRRVSVLMNSANPANEFFFAAMSSRARKLDLQLDRIVVTAAGELDDAVMRAKGGALVVLGDPLFGQNRARIVELTLRAQVPSVFGGRPFVAAGGLMSYLSSDAWHWRSAAGFVDRILKGAKPGDVPIEQPTKFELVINLKTAKALGLVIPQSLLLRADEVIQ